MKLSERGIKLITDEEGIRLNLYLDAVGVVTIGIGHAVKSPSPPYELLRGAEGLKRARAQFPNPLSQAEAEALLRKDVEEFEKRVFNLTKAVKLTQEMFDSLVSFDYNTGALGESTLLRKLKSGDFVGAAEQFDLWVYGKVRGIRKKLPGLVRRRGKEKAMFLEGVAKLAREGKLAGLEFPVTIPEGVTENVKS